MPFTRRNLAAMELETAIKKIDEGPESTPAELNTEFFTALTQFMTTLTGHTSVITDTDCNEYMLIYRS